ncbi:hypothetical protein F2P56_035206, partial [Juglans regia]
WLVNQSISLSEVSRRGCGRRSIVGRIVFCRGAGKEVLIKAVLQAIPSYTMSVFKLPKKLCKEINIILSKFWLGDCYKSLHPLVAKIFKEKYFKNTSITEAKLGNAHSLIWRSVWNSLGLLKEGLRWKVGDGPKINIWGKKWLLYMEKCLEFIGVTKGGAE